MLHESKATSCPNGIRWSKQLSRFRTPTKPADPLPSAHLAAGLGLLVRKAVQAAPEAAPIALEGVARTITLLPGLLLAPMNGNADPAQDYDNLLAARNHQQQQAVPLPPKPDEMRLAELEHALAAQTLTAQQEAELVILLAKVKGIHGQQLSDLPGTKLPTGSDFMRHRQERKPLGERPQSKKTGFLGSPKLTKPQLTALAKTAQEQYGVSVQVLKPKEMVLATDNPSVRAAFQTELDSDTGQRVGIIYVQKGATAYELTHELMHAKQFHQLGYEAYWRSQTRIQREEFVLNELMKNKNQWSEAEIEHANDYFSSVKNGKWPRK